MQGKQLIKGIYRFCPKSGQESWDYCGRQIGKTPSEVKKVLVCLDFDLTIYKQAEMFQPDLIVTHHPFIFGTYAHVLKEDECRKEAAAKIINELHTCIYSFHTCFDNAPQGMNDILARKLGLINIVTPPTCLTMRVGDLSREMEREAFVSYALKALNVSYGLLVKGKKEKIKKAAIIGGGASSYYKEAILAGADIYISGDMAHHTRREITERGFNYLDIPHEVERVFIPAMEGIIKKLDPAIQVLSIDQEKDASVYISSQRT
jgi:dinuclear metal center YbgI/SA1388 family protein